MNNVEFKTMRESMQLPFSWLAEYLGASLRMVKYYDTDRPITPDIEEKMERLNSIFINAIDQAKAQIDNAPPLESVFLLRYRTKEELDKYRKDMKPFPLSFHDAMIMRVREYALMKHIKCEVGYLYPDEYEMWRKKKKLPENESVRAQWLAEYLTETS